MKKPRKITRRPKLQVYCWTCNNWMYADDVGFINYKAGQQGERIMKFKCLCGEITSATVLGRIDRPTRRK